MAKDSADVVAKLPPPNGWQGWPTGIQASVKLEISIRRLRVLVQTGNITCYPCPDRTQRYDPAQLEVLARDLRLVNRRKLGDDGEDDTSDGLEDLEDERPAKPTTSDSINKTLVEALKNSNNMVLELHKLNITGTKTQAETHDKIISRLLEREEARERTISDVYLAREAYFNHQTERDLATKSAHNVENRRQEMWTITKAHLDKLVDVAFVKFGIPKELVEKLEPAIQLMQQLSPDQLQMLLGSGFLTKGQEELVKKIVKEVPPPENVAERVAAECAAIVAKQKDDEKAKQAELAQQAAATAAAPVNESTPAPAPTSPITPAANAGEAGTQPEATNESESTNA
jgi:hypothetical protein